MFHLMTHAFFKALLFLAAGIIIHALTGEQDIRRMGGLGRALPYTKWVFLAGSLALVGIPPFSGFFSKDPIIAAQLDLGGELGYFLFACCIAGTFLTGLYTFRLYFIVFGGEKSEFAREHLHEPHGRLEGPLSMVWPVGVLAVLAAFAGWIQFAPFWEPITHWLDPVARAADRGDRHAGADRVASAPSALGLAGIGVAWLFYVRKWRPVPKPWSILEEKFLFDELYDAVFYKPGRRALARAPARRRAAADRRLDHRGHEAASASARSSSAASRTASSARYALVLTSGDRRPRRRLHREPLMTDWLSTILIFLPMVGALVVWLVPMPRYWVGSLATLVSLIEIGVWVASVQHFDFDDGSLQLDQQHSWFTSLGVSYYVGQFDFSRLARRADGRLRRRRVRLRVVGRPRAAARVLRPAALPHRLGRRRLLRAGPAALLRLLRGDADPAVRADRRLGRRRAARRDDQVRRLHGRRLAADARGDHRLRPPGGHVRPDEDGAEHERRGSSSASRSRSR